jgi:hypothetical protein
MHEATRRWMAALTIWLGVLYLPYVGRGFIKDDFRWITEGRVDAITDVGRILTGNLGFYRPLVTLTFALDHALYGLHAYGYAVTNFVVLIACVWSVRRFALALGTDAVTATAAAALWALNFHGIGGSLLWISGRTSLLATLFGVLCMTAWVRQRDRSCVVWLALALLSKEDAVVLPVLMAVWSAIERQLRSDLWRLAWVCIPVVALYVWARESSGAFSYWNAPPYYRLTSDLSVIVRNVLEYADRNATLSTAGLIVLCAAARALPAPTTAGLRLVAFGLAWAAIVQSPTVALPARSSLSILLPSVGVTLAAAVLAQSVWSRHTASFRRNVAGAAAIIAVALWPVYHLRNQRLLKLASLSAETVQELQRLGSDADGRLVVLRDDLSSRTNFAAAFGTLLPEVHRLVLPNAAGLWLEPPPGDAPYSGLVRPAAPAIEAQLNNGRIVCCRYE